MLASLHRLHPRGVASVDAEESDHSPRNPAHAADLRPITLVPPEPFGGSRILAHGRSVAAPAAMAAGADAGRARAGAAHPRRRNGPGLGDASSCHAMG